MLVRRMHIQNGIVVNISRGNTEQSWTPPSGITIVELPEGSTVSIGWSYDGNQFTPPINKINEAVMQKPPQSDDYKASLENMNLYWHGKDKVYS